MKTIYDSNGELIPAPVLETLFLPTTDPDDYKVPKSFGSFFRDCYLGTEGRSYQQQFQSMLKANGWNASKFQTPSQLVKFVKANGGSQNTIDYIYMMGWWHVAEADYPKAYSLSEINQICGMFNGSDKSFVSHPSKYDDDAF